MTNDERRLAGLARQLGAREAARIDPAATADAVLGRLRAEAPRWRRWRRYVLPLAAAVVLAVGSGVAVDRLVPSGRAAGPPVPAGLGDLATAELTEVLDSLDVQAPVHELVPAGLGDLDQQELRQLLASMEG